MLKEDTPALKNFTMFWTQIRKHVVALKIFSDLVRFLDDAESNDFLSHAASCIQKLLLVKDDEGSRAYFIRYHSNYPDADNNLFSS